MHNPRKVRTFNSTAVGVLLLFTAISVAGCKPSPEANVITYILAKNLGTFSLTPDPRPPGSLSGVVLHAGQPIEGAAVVVAERYGTPHVAYTDEDGRYFIEGVPPGQYAPAAVAPGYDESVPSDRFGFHRLVTIQPDATTEAPDIELTPHVISPLPEPLAEYASLTETAVYTASAPFPENAASQVRSFVFQNDGVNNWWLRYYLPLDAHPDDEYPLLFVIYPGPTDNWEAISVALSSAGYAVIAMSPTEERGLDIDGHASDARVALNLALQGELGAGIAEGPAVAMSGSFSSPILRRLLRDEPDAFAAWIVLGGISDGYSLANDFYAGRITLPEMHNLAIPSLGLPNLFPLPFLRYSTIYAAAELPPTMVIHTESDDVTLIAQAYMLEDALERAGVPVEAYYYGDTSHYLQIGEDMTEAGKTMYKRVIDFVDDHVATP